MTLALYRENRDLFVVRAVEDKTDPGYEAYRITILKVIRNDPGHAVQYKDGGVFTCGHTRAPEYVNRFRSWTLEFITDIAV